MIRKMLSNFRRIDPDREIRSLVVAVSGGADSMALLHALVELKKPLGVELLVVHVNHRTRGEESEGDARFVRKICKELGVKAVIKAVDVPAEARRKRISLEMAARETRYRLFVEQAAKCKGAAIVTAHTKDDQAETVLLKLARGSGMRGLSGITEVGQVADVPLIRPMLGISRKEVERFLNRSKISWREDSSNADDSYLRNRVRHTVIPMLEWELNPEIKDTLVKTADVLREDNELLELMAEEALKVCRVGKKCLDLTELRQEHRSLVRRILLMWLLECGVEREAVDLGLVSEVEKLVSGRKANAAVSVTGGMTVTREYGRLTIGRVVKRKLGVFRRTLPVPGRLNIASAGAVIKSSITSEIVKKRGRPGVYPASATVSRKMVGRKKIVVRSWADGDRISPMGMKGSKKLKDVFIDLKIPASDRKKIPIFECDDEIIWVPGYRVARGWCVKEGDSAVLLSVDRL